MKTVNLLPQWYLQQQRQKTHLRVHVAAMLLMGVGMAGLTYASRERIASLQNSEADLAHQVVKVGNPRAELTAKEAELKRLENLQLAYRELGNTIPMSAVIQQVQNDMTVGMALSRVSIDVRSEPIKGAGMVGDPKHPPRNHDVVKLIVVGIAPNDVQIAQLIGKISSNPLFTDVSLNYTRTELLNGDRSIRRFEIQMQMDLDRLPSQDPDAPSNALAAGGPGHAG